MIKFGVITVDYEKHVPRDGAYAGLLSVLNQSYQNFHMFICHDGNKQIPYEKEFDLSSHYEKIKFLQTKMRINNWGHSSRDLAMRYAYDNSDCNYFIQFNIDNLFEPFAFQKIAEKIEKTKSELVIFTIRHHKLQGRGINHAIRFNGLPPVKYNIDCMQLVAHKDIWKKYKYWYDKSEQSDGFIYEKICKENNWVHIPEILGDNR